MNVVKVFYEYLNVRICNVNIMYVNDGLTLHIYNYQFMSRGLKRKVAECLEMDRVLFLRLAETTFHCYNLQILSLSNSLNWLKAVCSYGEHIQT